MSHDVDRMFTKQALYCCMCWNLSIVAMGDFLGKTEVLKSWNYFNQVSAVSMSLWVPSSDEIFVRLKEIKVEKAHIERLCTFYLFPPLFRVLCRLGNGSECGSLGFL